MTLQGKTALITGASRGIGRAIALSMAKAGASVLVNYQKNAEAAAAVVREIEAAGSKAVAVQGDVGSLAGIRQFFQSADAALYELCGGPRFDILVNNAGIGRGGTVATTSEETFDEVVAVNLKGPFFVTQQAFARLRDCGRIINLSSSLSMFAYPNMTVYSMLKAAVHWCGDRSDVSSSFFLRARNIEHIACFCLFSRAEREQKASRRRVEGE